MTLEEIALRIPKEYRDEIIKTNMIARAVGVGENNEMYYLYTIWKHFVEPTIGDCNLCFQRVLENFRKIQQTFIDLHQKEILLNQV